MSEERTRTMIKEYTKKYPFIKLLDNPKRIISCALNIGINNSRGDLIIWASSHNEYQEEYINGCIKYLKEYRADCVGGIIKTIPRTNNLLGKAIAQSISSSFGVGNSDFRIGSKNPKWASTVFGPCYKREIFNKIGLFNENLVYSQDMELSLRLRRAGLKILLVPELVSYYHARSSFKSFWWHNYRNGIWAIIPFKYSCFMPVSWRHLVPLVFVSGLFTLGILSLFYRYFLWFLLFILGPYFLLSLYFSLKIAIKEKNGKYILMMPFIFCSLHIAYGVGSLVGLSRTIISKKFWKNRFHR
jgi:GT2 family glycosyltransferase